MKSIAHDTRLLKASRLALSVALTHDKANLRPQKILPMDQPRKSDLWLYGATLLCVIAAAVLFVGAWIATPPL